MKLLTQAMEARFLEVGRQDIPNPEDHCFFGWVDGPFPELGYFSLDEMQGLRSHGLPIERDLHFGEVKLNVIKFEKSKGAVQHA